MPKPAPLAASAFDVEAIRRQFPILSRKVHGKPLVYLDNAASAQKPAAVLDALTNAYSETYANVHRGVHALSTESTLLFEQARERVRAYINAPTLDEVVFTKGGTEAINLVASGLAETIGDGDEIVVSEMEHHSNIVPWHFLRERNGAVLKWVPVTADGSFDLDAFARLLTPRTKIVAITHMSNVLGTVTPVAEIVRLAHAAGAVVLIDGCQGSVHQRVDVQALGCDFYVGTGHKLYGPSGIGFLYGRMEHLAAMRPYQGGGEMIDTVTKDWVTYGAPPHRFEAGTPPIVPAIGLGVALDWLGRLDMAEVAAHEHALLEHATEALEAIPGLSIMGKAPGKGALVSFVVDGIHASDMSAVLDRYGIAVRAGSHCAQPLMDRFGVPASLRASFALYNTHEEVDALAEGLAKAKTFFA
ncbi:cysteine desulfurase [Acuticoccus sediminis]|uniref:cysteine desulfurase n=1 Tax=Acuticoccus sediminis TaxID=2184697 RepID=UPI001CFC7C6F|nr:cysteine desulfurase [Acuticoccus sediminis]